MRACANGTSKSSFVRASLVYCFVCFTLTDTSAANEADALINFSGVKSGDNVVEFLPNDLSVGRLICEAIGANGHLYSVQMTQTDVVPPQSPASNDCHHASITLRARNFPAPELHSDSDDPGWVYEYWAQRLPIESFIAPEPLDAILLIDRYHELRAERFGKPNMLWINTSLLQALKPGGMLIIQELALSTSTKATIIKKEIVAAGFELVDERSASRDSSNTLLWKFRRP